MLESRPEDALVKLVKTVEIVEAAETACTAHPIPVTRVSNGYGEVQV